MSVSIIVLPLVTLLLLACLSIPILLGIFVYRDAKSRGMEPLLWALIAVLAPSFLGLIIYLIVRKNNIIMKCPTCGNEVQEHFTTCPGCGQKLKSGCPNCGTALKPEWKICPQCGNEVTHDTNFTPPVLNKSNGNKGLVGVIISILLIPVILILLIVVSAFANFAIVDSEDHIYSSDTAIVDLVESNIINSFGVMTSDDVSVLTDDNKTWIDEKLNSKDGIYTTTVYETETKDLFENEEQIGDYTITYAYTIIVVNAPDGKAYNFVNTNYSTDNLILTGLSVMLNEVDSAKIDEYKNVFVIKQIGDYTINTSDSSQFASLDDEQTFILNISQNNKSVDYDIPVEEDENFIPFAEK